MRKLAILALFLLAGALFASGHGHGEPCEGHGEDSECQCECTCEGTEEDCTGDCCTCEADCQGKDHCDEECDCGYHEEDKPEVTPHDCGGCGGGCH